MLKNFRNFLLCVISICSACAFGNQHSQPSLQDLQNRVTALEQSPTRPVGSCASNGYGVIFFAEPLYWRVQEDGLDYAIRGRYELITEGSATTPFFRLNLTKGEVVHPDVEWKWGFRVGIGYFLPYDGWDLTSKWTRFHNSASDEISQTGNPNPNDLINFGNGNGIGSYISPFWVAQLFDPPGLVTRARARWHYKLDIIDLDLGREFFISRRLSLKPILGMRTAWVKQKFNVLYQKNNHSDPTGPTGNAEGIERTMHVRMKNDFWGIGAKVGLNTRWFLGKGFSLYGNGALSVLDGYFDLCYQLHDDKPEATTATTLTIGPNVAGLISPHYHDGSKTAKAIHSIVLYVALGAGLS